MRYAIVESGGKQYRAVEGEVIDVDRLPDEAGKGNQPGARLADGRRRGSSMVGTPTVSGVEIKATVLDHVRGPQGGPFQVQPQEAHPRARRAPAAVHAAEG